MGRSLSSGAFVAQREVPAKGLIEAIEFVE
jgi:hypothetical protein